MRHILKPLLRHRMMPLLVVMQVALACAIVCNALFLLQQKLAPIVMNDGIAQPDHLIVAWQIMSRGGPWKTSRLIETQRALEALPGVSSVSTAGSLPMVTQTQFVASPRAVESGMEVNAAAYIGNNLVRTLGLTVTSGRDFSPEEQNYRNHGVGFNDSGPILMTRALADKLFPEGHPIGKILQLGGGGRSGTRTVVGIVSPLLGNDFDSVDGRHHNLDYVLLLPGIPANWPAPSFGVRVRDGVNPNAVRKQVAKVVKRTLGSGMVQGFEPAFDSYIALRHRSLARSRAAVWLLAGVTLVVLIVTLAGIMGMTAYWVQQRTRQIGIRRALGANKRDILRDLQAENLLVVGSGMVLGLALAYVVNLWLMHHYELSRLPWIYLPAGALLLLVLGQLAVLGPALRASRVPPVVATRSV